jgi:3'(2'), 5'-bisphosphate nucleotidase
VNRSINGSHNRDIGSLSIIIRIAIDAGLHILEEYDKHPSADSKVDDSPLTLADTRSHHYIADALAELTPDIPLLSEEGMNVPYSTRSTWTRFWCVDPMDGTKEFLKKTGDFTVNIALIENGKPILGVIHAPAKGWVYTAAKGKGAFFHETPDSEGVSIRTRPADKFKLDVVASKDHTGPQVTAMLAKIPGAGLKSMGSSLKFCMVAAGEADVYYRDVPTFEWDTAAAQIIVIEAGGAILTETGQPLAYNKSNLRNPSILTVGADADYWLELISN